MKRAGKFVLTAAIAGIAIAALVPYLSAAALIARAAGATGAIGRAARWEGRRVSDQWEQIPARRGPIRARIFRPSGPASRATLLVTGVHPAGTEEPRLVELASDLAATGVNVVAPDIPDLTAYRLTASVTDAIEDTAVWLASRADLAGGRGVGMIGVSFSGGLSIVAAGRPALRSRVTYVLSLGGHGNLPRVLRYLCTGIEPGDAGGVRRLRPPHDYGLAVVLHDAAESIVPPGQTEVLRDGVETFLEASALARIDADRSARAFDAARTLQSAMPEPAATLMKYVNDRDVAALGARLLPYLDTLGQDPSLSPDRSPFPSAPIYLLHGADDNVIPAVESELLAADLQRSTRVRVLLSHVLAHADMIRRPTAMETWRLMSFWKSLMAER
jgi:hypothetical protein